MSLKTKKKPFKFTFKVALRLIIFSAIIYLLVILLSSQKTVNSKPKIINTNDNSNQDSLNVNSLYNQIPESNRKKIEALNKSPVVTFFQKTFDQAKEQTKDFPGKQIKEIQKMIVTNIYKDMMKNIDEK